MSTYISLRDTRYSLDELDEAIGHSDFENDVINFIKKWHSGAESFEQYTSGSTGTPKCITLTRSQMIASASGTIKALNLKPNSTSLLCMNPKYIGAKMMIVRSLLNKMNLVVEEPSTYPLKNITQTIDFVALTPHQLSVTMETDQSMQKLNEINTIILGGAPVSYALQLKLDKLDSKVYSTFGMTETSSHIALKRLNGDEKSEYYNALDKVELGITDEGCLTINGAVTNFNKIVTNDRVRLISERQFEWIGRVDNVINSGGIKIQCEQVEKAAQQSLFDLGLDNRIFVTGLPDKYLGEVVVLFIEGEIEKNTLSKIEASLSEKIEKYHMPKKIYVVPNFEVTASGKVDRIKTKAPFV